MSVARDEYNAEGTEGTKFRMYAQAGAMSLPRLYAFNELVLKMNYCTRWFGLLARRVAALGAGLAAAKYRVVSIHS